MSDIKKNDIVDDNIPIQWGIVADAETEGYKIFDERITPVTGENYNKVEALNGLLNVLTQEK